jgi:ubiquinone/menaquinone biosynthesis C-methylase UbiE
MLSKEKKYFNFTRRELIKFVKKGNNRVLEIGCGTGNTGRALKEEKKAMEVTGIELIPEIAEAAKSKLDRVICGDIEVLDLPFREEYFDYIIAGDVLEHLSDPWKTLNKIRRYIKRGGYIIASIPNVRNWRIIRDLILKGKWEYSQSGTLDDTHLRFFTKKSIIKMFKNSEFGKIKIVPVFKTDSKKSKSHLINIFTFGLFEEFLTPAYIVKAIKL